MLELRGVRHVYEGRVVLDLAQFAVPRGSLIAIVGHNGSGKSTLLRLLALLERPTAGEVLLDGRVVWAGSASKGFLAGRPKGLPIGRPKGLPIGRARRRVTLVEQRPMLFRGTVRDNLGYGLRARGIRRTEMSRFMETVAERLGVTPLLERRRHELSDGEVQRVAVARALVVRPDVLLLDEPVSSADRAAAQALYRVLEAERRERGLTICLASHQLEDAYRWADDIRALAEGRLSPVTPENLFRVELPAAATAKPAGTKHVKVGPIEIAVMTDKIGPAILAVPPTDIFVSTVPARSSARNVFPGRVTRVARPRPGEVHVAADVGGGVELIAVVTEEAARELALVPGLPVVYAFKASAVRVF
ncbi:MAG: ATP-binding cassette domain-containing protein [Gemmatimonadetes bacterium]|nr:ATP-binding cassette domain-containing protein [Gemmatimonadota bacterium]